MALHKSPNNSIHDDMDGTALNMLPAGCVEITAEEAEELRQKPSDADIIEGKKAAIRQVREGILNRLAGIAFAAQLEGDTDTTDAYLVVRTGLLDITSGLPTDPTLVDAEVMTRYAGIVVQCTPEMVSAFAEIDA